MRIKYFSIPEKIDKVETISGPVISDHPIVEDIEWPFDKQSKARRNFAFIVFEEENAADLAASVPKQTFGTREVCFM